jgi:hypothetical protein
MVLVAAAFDVRAFEIALSAESNAAPTAEISDIIRPAPATAQVTPPRNPNAPEVEPGKARVKILKDDWILKSPSRLAGKLVKLEPGKFIMVTGSTRDYLRVRLSSGEVGYIDPAAVELIRPADTIFMVTRPSPVFEKPNRFSKKVADVVANRPVRVTGFALDYARIKLRSGVVGFVPFSAFQ